MKTLIKKLFNKLPTTIKYIIVLILGGAIGILPWFTSCSILKKYPQDNVIEEFIEDAIEEEIGIDIDLSPSSRET